MLNDRVNAWAERIKIPTYKIGAPDKNPMFLEKRVYQGSSGAVYPHPVIDRIFDEKEDQEYTALFLENRYLKIMILPEIGGRVQMALDKTNGYHFIYYNRVIKPALVGLAGPWISGGIEFNWPQHHRPSTFDPLDWRIEEHAGRQPDRLVRRDRAHVPHQGHARLHACTPSGPTGNPRAALQPHQPSRRPSCGGPTRPCTCTTNTSPSSRRMCTP